MGLIKWRCDYCQKINNSYAFEDGLVSVRCAWCMREQTVERRGRTDTLHYGARRVV